MSASDLTNRTDHLSECMLEMLSDDPDAHCTCDDWYPESDSD